MAIDGTRIYERIPERFRRLARRAAYTADPRYSWSDRRRMERVDERFVDRFFEDESEFEAYRREFFDGRVVDVCERAAAAAPEGTTIFDAHREPCAKIYALVRKREPGTLVETGVHNGVSTLSMLLALDRNGAGTLYSVDEARHPVRATNGAGATTGDDASAGDVAEAVIDAAAAAGDGLAAGSFYERGRPSCAEPRSTVVPPDEAPGWIVPADLHDRWELSTGRGRRELVELLSGIDEVDLFLHDSAVSTSRMLFEFELAWAWLAEGGLLLSNHVARNDAFEAFVADRDPEHGLFDYRYDLRFDDYDEPCSAGYVVKS